MAFGFLGRIVNDIGHDVSTVARGNSSSGGGVFGFLNHNVTQLIVNQGAKVANEARALPAVVTGNQQAARNILSGGGFAHQGGVLGGAELDNGAVLANPGNIKKVVGTGLSLGTALVAPGAGAGETIAAKALSGAARGAPLGFLGAAGGQLQTDQFDAKQLVGGAVGGALLGAGTPLAGAGVKAGIARHQEALDAQVKSQVPRASVKDQQVMRDYNDYLVGANKPVGSELNTLIANAKEVGLKHNVDLTANNTVEGRINAANSILDQIGKDRQAASQGGFIALPSKGIPENIHEIQTPGGVVRIGQDELNKLSQAKSSAEVKQVIGNSLPENITNRLSQVLPHTQDPNIIKNIISRELSPPSPPHPQISDFRSTPVTETLPSAGQGTSPSLEQQIIGHLNDKEGAIQTRETQEAGYSSERSARLARSQAAGADLPGLEGHQAELTALGGSLKKEEYSGLSHLSPDQQDNFFTQGRTQIKADSNIQGYDKINTAEALRKVIYGNGGVPTRSEIKLLQKAFGSDFSNAVQDNIHSTLGQKAFALWRAGLLTGPQTITKIITSHGVNEVLETLKDVPAAAVDKFASLISGNRTLALTLKGKGEGFVQGAKTGKELLTTGVDRNPGSNSVEFRNQVQFGNHVPGKVAQAYVDFVGRAHGSLYKPFYGSAHLNSLYSTAIAAAKNNGLRGAERDAFVQDLVRNPSKEALAIADHDAQMNSFQQQTALSQAAGALQKIPVIGKVLAPFTRIPAAIATDLINYSPAGAAKTIFESIQAAKSDVGWTLADQRKLSQGLGRSITGTAAIIPGMMLYNKGIMTLGYPTDPKEQQLWAQEGKQPNSILIRGKWRSLGSLGPTGSVLEIGGHTADSLLQGKDIQSAIVDGFAGGAQSIEEQSYLKGVSGAVSALNDPGRYAAGFEKQTAGSIIPTLSNTIASATDKFTRQSSSPLDAIKSRIPGQRETLPTKLDTFGNPVPNSEVGADRIIDPFQSSTAAPSAPLTNELRRLQNAGQGIVPSSIKKVESFNGVKTPLTPQQVRQLTIAIGQQTQQEWQSLVTDPSYKELPDDQKKQLLTKYYDQAVTQQKEQFAEQIQGGIFSPTFSTDKVQSKQGRQYIFQ